MQDTMRKLTDALLCKNVQGLSFEYSYRTVFNAIAHWKLGDAWLEELKGSVSRLVLAFRSDEAYYEYTMQAVRDVCMFADMTYCSLNGRRHVRDIFGDAWAEWHSNRTVRARALWACVRAKRARLLAVSTMLWILQEVQVRPETGSKYKTAKIRFEGAAAATQQQHSDGIDCLS